MPSVYEMVSGIGKSFGDSYTAARKQALEEEAPDLITNLMSAYQGGSTAPAAVASAPAAADAASPRSTPTFVGLSGSAPSVSPKLAGSNADFISAMMPHAIEASKATGVDPRIILAQSAIETGWGRSAPGNNYFGIKSHGSPGGNTLATTEVIDGVPTRVNDSFRAFPSMAASAAGYADFINANPRYAGLKGAQGLEAQADALQRSGYATDPKYGAKVLSIARGIPQADMPAPDAQPAGFQIPGQPVPAAAAPAAQGFAGFGSPAARITPQMQTALTAAWRNPETRAFATQIYGNLLKGKESAWSLTTMGDQPVLFNQSTAQIIPMGQGKRQTATVGDTVVDVTNGQPIYKAEKDDKFTYQSMPGVGMVALHPTDPDKSRVIIAGQQPRPMTPEERTAYGLTADQPAGMGADGKPFGIGSGKTTVNVDTKGAGKFSEKANELAAKRYGEMVEAADRAVPLRADIETLSNFAAQINTGRLAEARLGLAQYANDVSLTSIANSLTGGKMGEMEAFSALVDKLTPQMRVPGSGATSDREGAAFKNSLPSLLKSQGGNAIIADTFRGLADYQAAAGEIAGKALRSEMSQAEADQAIRALPSPYTRFREYQGAQKGSQPGAPTVAKDADRTPLPDGYSAGRAISEAKAAVKAGKDKAVVAERLRAYGIDPKRLDD
ncbi:glycoside hydrolase family 73 protein [Methylobacterium oxalidis]|uniref:Mannosyl-glycoprotein endo-beta-N-acetylglucosamidase-like domain-containing protein n=1 Tax=Methylobacterium oxalidis TaxID=944322 RepID=A0A512J234_9HYPH|nr:glucosaminidase domain-containing protein [Methylobacterium oxalidis]GEP04028.1 hypothetical protein MOX02_20660 [Methylobacterium oxalidis]GJE34847.1 hypothetical protein LDDCCGHA_5062 [Methylobacterium oxalidis]GLS64059.1 hypothetical protein GCM10007888_24400 [Methylobacterium oxalidis]